MQVGGQCDHDSKQERPRPEVSGKLPVDFPRSPVSGLPGAEPCSKFLLLVRSHREQCAFALRVDADLLMLVEHEAVAAANVEQASLQDLELLGRGTQCADDRADIQIKHGRDSVDLG